MNKFLPKLPDFKPTIVWGRRANKVRIDLGGGEFYDTHNIIPRKEVSAQVKLFCKDVLNPIISGEQTTLVPVLNGALVFVADLLKEIDEGATVEVMSVPARSYGKGRVSHEVIVAEQAINPENVTGRTVIIVDDVYDSGRTCEAVTKALLPYDPKLILSVFLLKKNLVQEASFPPDYYLFEIHGETWCFGSGLDLNGHFRQLRYVADDRRDLYDEYGCPTYKV